MSDKSSDELNRSGPRAFLTWLYRGEGRGPFAFRWAVLVFDCLTIGYFLWAPFEEYGKSHGAVDLTIGAVIALDLAARFYIARHRHRFFLSWRNWADFVVVLTMMLPLLVSNFAFLRVLRAVRAVRAFTFVKRLRVLTPFFLRHEQLIDKVTNLVVFVFIMAALVYATQVAANPQVSTYIDALYFTVTTLTTTGYGDILMEGRGGKLLSIFIMVLGLTLFLQLLRTLVEPDSKVELECPDCGLQRHDRDAVHCKHCGRTIHIDTRGFQ